MHSACNVHITSRSTQGWVMQASGALRVLDTLVMGTNAEPHSILVPVHRRDLVNSLSLDICSLHGASCVMGTFAIDVCCRHAIQIRSVWGLRTFWMTGGIGMKATMTAKLLMTKT